MVIRLWEVGQAQRKKDCTFVKIRIRELVGVDF